MTFDVKPSTFSPKVFRSSSIICLAIFAYLEFSSMPTLFRPARKAATRVEPVPAMGSRTVSPVFVKNSMNSCAIVSGYLAGWTITPFLRGGGLWMNHDFWNFSHSLLVRLLSLFFIFITHVIARPRWLSSAECNEARIETKGSKRRRGAVATQSQVTFKQKLECELRLPRAPLRLRTHLHDLPGKSHAGASVVLRSARAPSQ